MRRLLITLLVLLGLLVAADFGLRYYATRQVGEAVATRLQLATAPDVTVSGFPFLLQAINGRYDTISAQLPAQQLGGVDGVAVSVDLIGVKLPLSDALKGNLDAMTADSSQVRLQIPIASIAAAIHLPSLQVTSGDGRLQISATVEVLGVSYPATGELNVQIVASTLQLRNGTITSIGGVNIPAEVSQALTQLVSLDIPLDSLPFTVERGSASVADATLVVDASTSNLNFAKIG